MSRRGEVPFVAVRVGRSSDPREVLGPAHALKIDRATMLGYVVLWEEFILEVGDAMTGRIKGYTAAHIAAKLGWRGRVDKLIDALEGAGLLKRQKGTFFHPSWLETPTGEYARRKAHDRETWRKEKEAQRAAARARELGSNGADISPESGWTTAGRPSGLHPENAQKERKDSTGHTPQAPAPSAGELASRRWEWLLNNHKRPTNPDGCRQILGAMTEEDWRLIQWALTPDVSGGGLNSLSKLRLMRRTSYEFLRRSAYLEIRPRYLAKVAPPAAPKNGHGKAAKPDEATPEARRASAAAFVLAQLADPDLSDAKKASIKRRWMEDHGSPAPWEGLTADPPAN